MGQHMSTLSTDLPTYVVEGQYPAPPSGRNLLQEHERSPSTAKRPTSYFKLLRFA